MADNVTFQTTVATPPSGTIVATDDVGGVMFQKMKLDVGGDGASLALSNTNPLPVSDAGGSFTVDGSVSITGSVTVDSELPAAAALTDNFANPTAPAVGAFGMVWDGATWDRAPGSAADGQLVNLGANNDVTVTGTVTANQGGTWNIGTVTTLTGITNALPAGTNNIGDVDVLTLPAATNAGATAKTSDYDTGAGTDTVTMFGVALPASGGAVQGGTATNPLRTDPTGTTTQPVSLASVPSHAVTNAGTFAVQADSVIPGTGATNLGKAEDAPHTSGDVGVLAMGVRRDADTTPVSADGDYHAFLFDALGNLKVNIKAGAGSGGTALADNAAYTPGTTNFTPVGGEVDDTATSAATEGSAAAARITPQRAIHVNLRDNAGAEVSVGGGTQYTEDAVAAANPVGNAIIAVRDDARAGSLVSADGDNVALRGTNAGELYVKHVDALPASQSGTWNVGTVTTVTTVSAVTAITNALPAGTNNIGDVDVLTLPAATNAGATAKTSDYDSGAGTDTVTMFGLALPASGGAVQGGTATNPLRTDPTGTTTQPVSGTVTANAGSGTFTVSGTVTANAGTGTMAVDSELPAAAALADAASATPTTPTVGAVGLVMNATTLDRQRAVVNGLDSTGTGIAAAGIVGQLDDTATGAVTENQFAPVRISTRRALLVEGVASGTALGAAQSGTWTVQPGNTANTTPWLVTPTPGTTGGWSKVKYAAQTTTVQTVKGSAGTFGGYYVYNPNASVAYVQVFDVSGAVTLGTTAPDLVYGIPATSGANLEITNGVNFANAIKLACTTTATGSTAPGTGLDLSIYYK